MLVQSYDVPWSLLFYYMMYRDVSSITPRIVDLITRCDVVTIRDCIVLQTLEVGVRIVYLYVLKPYQDVVTNSKKT